MSCISQLMLLLVTLSTGFVAVSTAATLLTSDAVAQPNIVTPDNRTLCPETPANRPGNRVNTTLRLAELRREMSSLSLDAYVILMTDEHGSEGSGYHGRIQYISGFSGSNGWAVVTSTQAALWTDGRYYLQADHQLDCSWIMMKSGETGYPTTTGWIIQVLTPNTRVGAYPSYVASSTWLSYAAALDKVNITMTPVDTQDLVDKIWSAADTNRPTIPNTQLIVHDVIYTGRSWQDKLDDVRTAMVTAEADVLVVTVREEVAWLFNLRADAISDPLFYGYAFVLRNESRLYLRNYSSIISNAAIRTHLQVNATTGQCLDAGSTNCIKIAEYSQAVDDILALSTGNKIWVDPSTNYAIYQSAGEKRVVSTSPIDRLKKVKNDVEREQFTKCIVRDSAAVVEFISFLEKEVKEGKVWNEITASEKLLAIRRMYEHNRGSSFDTIAGYGPNGAVIHYRAEPETNVDISTDSTFLLDSGGQYLDGTTDVTRTLHFGTPTSQIKEAYTLVLMGQIDLAATVFPAGVSGGSLDVRARAFLWQKGLNYNHGTGHGIGFFLSVHETGRISVGVDSEILEGMFLSDEPGYYEDGKFGIRLENLVMVEEADTPYQFGNKQYLALRTKTLVPYEPHLIDYSALSASQIAWLNEYNKRCRDEVGSYLLNEGKQEAHDWLVDRTKPITVGDGGVSVGTRSRGAVELIIGLSAVIAVLLGR